MTTTPIFKSNQTQAVRLPKDVAFPDDVKQVRIIKRGKSRLITPVGSSWDEFFNSENRMSDDFMTDRNQPMPQVRDSLDDL